MVKNRLAKRATERAGTAELDQLFVGPTALAFVKGDAVTAAKAIATFGRQHDILEYKGGLMDGAPLDPEQFGAIARLPGLDVLRGQLVGVVASPLTGLTRGLASMLSGLAVALGEIAEQGLVGGEADEAARRRRPPSEAERPEATGGQPERRSDRSRSAGGAGGARARGRDGGFRRGSRDFREDRKHEEESPEESEADGKDSEGAELRRTTDGQPKPCPPKNGSRS